MAKTFLIWGCTLAGIGVVLGAFGAHGLKKLVDANTLGSYQTGVQYQLYHALALLAVGILLRNFQPASFSLAGYCFLLGILFFSGSIYAITFLKSMNNPVPTVVGILTPIGGLFFIAGWIALLFSVIKN